jgi:bifunctional DNase/RNase
MSDAAFLRMSVGGLALDPMTKTPVVLLRDESEKVTLPIWIGALEATALATELEGIKMARPMTHDLLRTLLEETGAVVARVEVTELRNNTFHAVIQLEIDGSARPVDARPSDAIALALRTGAPIFVARAVVEAVAAAAERAGAERSAPGPEPAGDTPDLSEVAPEEWGRILEKLDPDDFKYKM